MATPKFRWSVWWWKLARLLGPTLRLRRYAIPDRRIERNDDYDIQPAWGERTAPSQELD